MNQIKFIKLNNIFDTKIQIKQNDNIINIIDNIKLNNNQNNIYIGPIINNKPSNISYLLTKNQLLINGLFNSTINNIHDCNIELDDIILKGNIINQYFNNGTIIYKNTNEQFIGEFNKEGLPNGYCNYINKNTNVSYEGQWLNGNLQGHGTFKNEVFQYNGLYENNLFNGLGKIIYYNDFSYEGAFSNNKKHGNGKYIDFKNNNTEYYVECYNDNFVVKISYLEKENNDLKKENNSLNNLLQINNIIIQSKDQDIQKLKSEIEEQNLINEQLDKKGKCTICYSENSTILLPCGHLCMCLPCELNLRTYSNRRCPLCRKQYNALHVKKVIIS